MVSVPLRTLEGIKVVAFTQFLLGPAGVQYLSDLGAEVVKVEPPGGAWERHWSGGELYLNGESVFFLMAHRNARSIVVDLKTEAGQEIARRLIARSDVLVENYRPGVMARFGLDYEAARAINPRLIYVVCSGFGEHSPYRDMAGQDLLLQGRTGLAFITGNDDGAPTAVGSPVIDQHGAALVALGTLAALIERQRTGRGQRIEVTMVEAGLDLQQEPISYHLNGFPIRRGPRGLASGFHPAPYGIFKTKDDYIVMSMSPVARLNAVLQLDELRPFEDVALRFTARQAISRILAPVLETRTTAEWCDLFRAHDIWCAPVNDYDRALADPAVRYLDPVVEIEHPRAGPVKLLRHPVRYEAGEPHIRRPPPLVGEHTDEILRELGYTAEQICDLHRSGVVYGDDGSTG